MIKENGYPTLWLAAFLYAAIFESWAALREPCLSDFVLSTSRLASIAL